MVATRSYEKETFMAKVTAPLLSFSAAGTIAKTQVYATWKGRAYVRRHVVPSNPNTVAQQSTRNTFSSASSVWKIADPLLATPWDRFADGQVLSGRNAFMSSFVRNLRGKTDLVDMIFSPGAKGGFAPVSMVLTPGVDQITVDLTEPTLPSGWTIQSGIASAIFDQNPETMTDFRSVTVEDLSTPFSIVLTGLTSVGPHQVGGWFRYAKPDGSIAYGPSLQAQDTPT